MRYGTTRARYEATLAAAHRAMWQCGNLADQMNDEGAMNDCQGILAEIHRLAEASLKGNLRQTAIMRGQTKPWE